MRAATKIVTLKNWLERPLRAASTSPTTSPPSTPPFDATALDALYGDAFPDEDLRPLLKGLQRDGLRVIVLAAMIDQALAGHISFTGCHIAGQEGEAGKEGGVALLGPLAVVTTWQRQGVGRALIRAGIQELEHGGVRQVFVLGDPAYYGRFGFAPEVHVTPPYPLPKEWAGAWQSLSLRQDPVALSGQLVVPEPWRDEALWTS